MDSIETNFKLHILHGFYMHTGSIENSAFDVILNANRCVNDLRGNENLELPTLNARCTQFIPTNVCTYTHR